MNYKLIMDEAKLDEFIEWLPELRKDDDENEVYYMCLFARKKYFKDIISTSNDKTQLRRELVKKHSIKRELRKWECALGTYQLKNDTVPQEALAVYITPNPRSMKKALYGNGTKQEGFAMECLRMISNGNVPHNLHQNAISSVQKAKSYTYVVDFDIDTKDVDFNDLWDIVPKEATSILETRGGYHVLIQPKHNMFIAKEYFDRINPDQPNSFKQYPKNWYQKIQQLYKVDQTGDNMIPIPGCCQGNFCPRFINI